MHKHTHHIAIDIFFSTFWTGRPLRCEYSALPLSSGPPQAGHLLRSWPECLCTRTWLRCRPLWRPAVCGPGGDCAPDGPPSRGPRPWPDEGREKNMVYQQQHYYFMLLKLHTHKLNGQSSTHLPARWDGVWAAAAACAERTSSGTCPVVATREKHIIHNYSLLDSPRWRRGSRAEPWAAACSDSAACDSAPRTPAITTPLWRWTQH